MTRRLLLEDAIGLEFGFAFKSGNFNTDGAGLPLVRIRDVVPGRSSTFYDGDFDPRYLVIDGDYLIGMDGEFNVGRWFGGKALLNQRVAKLGEPAEGVDKDYIARFLPAALKAIEDQTPFVTVKHLSAKALRAIEVPLPPLDEQRRIAAILDRADALVATRMQEAALFDALAASLFFDLFGDPVANPKHWKATRLADQIDTMQYGPRFYNESYSDQGTPIVRITDLDGYGRLDFDSMPRMTVTDEDRSKHGLMPGDIVFARTGATVGKLALIREGDPLCIAGAYFIRMRFTRAVEPAYVAGVLRSPSIQSIVVSGSHQSAQQNFSGPGLRALPLPVPPIELQREFTNAVSGIDKRRQALSQASEATRQLFASLQSRAFRGELSRNSAEPATPTSQNA